MDLNTNKNEENLKRKCETESELSKKQSKSSVDFEDDSINVSHNEFFSQIMASFFKLHLKRDFYNF